jgi:hypothetical protein
MRSRVSYRVRRLVVQRGIERNSDDIGGDVHGTENRTGDPALRWEVARVWRLGRQVSYVKLSRPSQN